MIATAAVRRAPVWDQLCGLCNWPRLPLQRLFASAPASSQGAEELLNSLINYEQQGIPANAGLASSANRFDLSRMHKLLHAMGNPQQQLKAVHIAGSKGKGSTAAFLSHILSASGLKVGTYTSPHMHHITERMAINARPIAPDDMEFLLGQHAAAIRRTQAEEQGQLSHFEVVTALSLRYFADCHVDMAVIETGLGGATDATNVFDESSLQAAIITSLGLEHVEALGGNLQTIAAAKAGIFKHGRPAIIAHQPHAAVVMPVLQTHAQELGAPLIMADAVATVSSQGLILAANSDTPSYGGHTRQSGTASSCVHEAVHVQWDCTPMTTALAGSSSSHSSGQLSASLQLVGPHQHANVSAAVSCALLLRHEGWGSISDDAISLGLSQAMLPGRFQVVRLPITQSSAGRADGQGPLYAVLDGAHTEDSAAALAHSVRQAFPHAPIALVMSMAADKEHRAVVQALRELSPRVALFTAVPIAGSYQRAATPGTLLGAWQAAALMPGAPRTRGPRCREMVQASLTAAFERALMELRGIAATAPTAQAAAQQACAGVVVVTGSLHAVAAALRLPQLSGAKRL